MNGVPAFPNPMLADLRVAKEAAELGADFLDAMKGMTLRDYFAAKALVGLLACPNSEPGPASEWAADAYAFADAMLKARDA